METSKGYCKPYSVSPSMDSLAFFYDYQPLTGHEFKFKSPMTENRIIHNVGRNTEKKRRLTSKEMDFLERNFNEEMKLEPERKMKLSIELGIEPRQVAVWFQNRRARWKNKQLEQAYDALKQELEVVSKEKRDLQEEILRLKAELEDRTTNKYVTGMYAEEETAESTVMVSGSTKNHQIRCHAVAECSYLLQVEDRNPNSQSGSDWIFWSDS